MKMKRFINIFLVCILFYSSGCDTWESDLNVDPNITSEGGESTTDYEYEPSEFMVDMLNYVVRGWDYIYWNVCPAVCEYHGKTISLSQGNRHQAWHAFDDSPHGGPWNSGYAAVRFISSMRSAAIDNEDAAYQSIATIWECYNFFNLTLMYGDIPYSESIMEDAPLTPKYDNQEEIYRTLIEKLKEAGKAIDPTEQVDSETDLIFSGDMARWQKFANTLLIRYAMYMSDADQEAAITLLNEILNNPGSYPVMESNSDNASFHYNGVDLRARFYWLSSAKIDEAPFSNVFIERLVSLKDPRLPIYARPVKLVHDDANNNVLPSNAGTDKYAGHIYGITTDNAYASAWNSGSNYASKLGSYFRSVDEKGNPTDESGRVPMNLATYSEMLFFLAEAAEKGWISNETAETYYNAAVNASFEQYEVSFNSEVYEGAFATEGFSSVDEYLAQQSVAYTGGRDPLNLIAEQKWIASFLLCYEPYFDHRRTMLPEWRASSGSVAYSATGSATKFPSRAAYPNSEASLNANNVADAKANGFDIPITDQETRNEALMWLLESKGQDWLQMPVFQEPNYKSEYPVKSGDAEYGTAFKSWYDAHWNTMFWWKNE